jgi:hypothetical protein
VRLLLSSSSPASFFAAAEVWYGGKHGPRRGRVRAWTCEGKRFALLAGTAAALGGWECSNCVETRFSHFVRGTTTHDRHVAKPGLARGGAVGADWGKEGTQIGSVHHLFEGNHDLWEPIIQRPTRRLISIDGETKELCDWPPALRRLAGF